MKTSRLSIVVICFLLATVIIATPGYMRGEFEPLSAAPDSPPVAADDVYIKHGGGTIGPLLANDSDPDGDPMTVQIMTFPTRGTLSGLNGNSFNYQLNVLSYVGSDSFTYRACAAGVCSNTATVTIVLVNQAPVGGTDSYQVHGSTNIGPMLDNDFDPDGDPISFVLVTGPSHGTLSGLAFPTFPSDMKRYASNFLFVGTDTFTYKVCDSLQLCSSPVTVSLNVYNNPPTPGDDMYFVPPDGIIGPMFANDSDPDGDGFNGPFVFGGGAAHGTVFGLATPPFSVDTKRYVPQAGFSGVDTFQYQNIDFLGGSGTATVTLFVPERDDAENNGRTSCNASIGRPVNVTNGNMYVEQADYNLPGVGPGLSIARTYNSSLSTVGLFGRGWTTGYDQSIKIYANIFVRLNLPDGRAVYFTRPNPSANFSPVQKDFHGQLTGNGDGSFTLNFPDGSLSRFNASGKLLSLADRNGNQTTLNYDAGGKLSSITDPSGRSLTFITNATGQVLSLSDSMGTVATYTYGTGGQLQSVVYADNSAFQFTYDAGLRLTAVNDALGNLVESHSYDAQGRALTSATHGNVERYNFNYLSNTQTEVTDALGRVSRFTFDKSKGRNVVTKVEGFCSCGGSQVQTWTYDNQSNVTTQTDALNHTRTFTYDNSGNRLTETDATGTVTYSYNQFGDVLTRTDQLNGLVSNTYDTAGKLLTTSDALSNTTTLTYDARGQLLTVTNARGKVTSFTYDGFGNLTQQRDGNNVTSFFFYDARGRLTKFRDGLSRSTQYGYDAVGRIKKITHPDLSFVSFVYDLAGRRTSVTDERGNPTNSVYDGAYRLTAVTDALGQTTSYGYDAMSNLTSMVDALGRVTNYEYDDFNRLKKVIHPAAIPGGTRLFESIAYDAAGNVTQRTDTAGRVSGFTYDDVDRTTSTTDADNKTTTFTYDALSRTTTVVDALNQHYLLGYDANGRRTSVTRGGGTMTFQYDAVGNTTRRTDYNGTITNYSYDNLNRLTTINYSTRTATYAYDPLNNLTRASNENGSVYIGYDNRYRVSSFSDPFYYGISYNYDAAGNRTKLKLNGASYANYTYDAVNRLTNLSDSAGQNFLHSYDAVNRLTARSAPNGITSAFTYDGLSRLTTLNHTAGGTSILGNVYTYNDAHNISTWTNSSGHHTYGYDLVDRLTSATNSSPPNESYSYDEVGNRTSSHRSSIHNYQPFSRLTNTSTGTYSYDSNGNLLSKTDALGTTTFSWNEENQLRQVTLPNGLTVSYKYDALGRRIQRATSAGANERYVYDGQNVLLDLNADWSVANQYLNGPGIDNHLRQTNSVSGVHYFLTDHLGSTAGLTDPAGNVLEQIAYDSFGNSTGSLRTRYGYTGRERDPDTGLMYYRARFYDPQLGRFISEDPIGLAGGINQFSYVSNSPQNRTDPSGLYEIDVHYYLTYFLALKTGCFSAAEARLIADADQGTDEDPRTLPGPGSSAQQRHQNRMYHSLHEGAAEGVGNPVLWQEAMNGPTNYVGLGRYLHYLQDSFSHAGYESDVTGHATAMHYYDKTASDVPRALRMAGATWNALNDFAKEKKCGCKGRWDSSWWKQVIDFSKSPGANFGALETIDSNGELSNLGMTNAPHFLRLKVRILDVPFR